MGGKKKTVHHTTRTPNDYNDAWIRSKFGDVDLAAQQFGQWQAGREQQVLREQSLRDQMQRDLSGQQAALAAQAANIGNLQSGASGLAADFAGLSAGQQQQMKDLYNLAQSGQGVSGVRTAQGLTFTRPRAAGAGTLNRQQLQTGSLTI